MPVKPRPKVPVRERLLVTGHELYPRMGLSKARFSELRKKGFLPRPIRFPDSKTAYYRLPEVVDYLAAGCPPLIDWKWTPRVSFDTEALLVALKRLEDKVERLAKVIEMRRISDS